MGRGLLESGQKTGCGMGSNAAMNVCFLKK